MRVRIAAQTGGQVPDMPINRSGSISYGGWLLAAASVVGLGCAAYYYLVPTTGVAHSYGAALVFASTALLAAASLVMVLVYHKPAWALGFLYVSMFLDIVGTGFAAYFLEAYWLLAAMAVALVGWLVRATLDPSDEEIAISAIRRKVLS